jgi:hypothetical protein
VIAMTTRWFIILLLVPWFGGCAATNLVTPSLQVGSSTLTLITDFTLAGTQTSSLTASETDELNHTIGLQSTVRF